MDKLTSTMINAFGEKGRKWLAELPQRIDTLTAHWALSHLQPVDNMSFHFVAKAIANQHSPVVLKMGCDEKSIQDEKKALTYFNGVASIKLIDHHAQHHALLLKQAIPGVTLKSLYPEKANFVMDCYVNVLKKLHQKKSPSAHAFQSIDDWLTAIDHVDPQKIPAHLLKKAIELKTHLLNSSQQKILLHGDLHHDNILQDGDTWITIDPKGIVGEPEFEIAAFDFMYVNELASERNVKEIFNSRINLLSEKAHLNAHRIKDWVFVRLILMAAWSIEDGGDASRAIQLAEMLF